MYCKFCNEKLHNKANIFCNRSCSAKFNNKGLKRNGNNIDWIAVSQFILEGNTYKKSAKHFNIAIATICKAKARGDFSLELYRQINLDANSYANKINGISAKPHHRKNLRKKMLAEGLIYKCNHCGISDWMNKKISLEVDHIDGNSANNLLENLRLLCPNCHSQTNTWRGRNTKLAKKNRIECDSVYRGSNP